MSDRGPTVRRIRFRSPAQADEQMKRVIACVIGPQSRIRNVQVTDGRIHLQGRLQGDQESNTDIDREHPPAAVRRERCARRILNAATQFVIGCKRGATLMLPLERDVGAERHSFAPRRIALRSRIEVRHDPVLMQRHAPGLRDTVPVQGSPRITLTTVTRSLQWRRRCDLPVRLITRVVSYEGNKTPETICCALFPGLRCPGRTAGKKCQHDAATEEFPGVHDSAGGYNPSGVLSVNDSGSPPTST